MNTSWGDSETWITLYNAWQNFPPNALWASLLHLKFPSLAFSPSQESLRFSACLHDFSMPKFLQLSPSFRSFPSHPLQKPPLHFDGKIICSLAWILPVFFSSIHPRQHLGLLTYKNVNFITHLRMGDQGSLSSSSHSISSNLLR